MREQTFDRMRLAKHFFSSARRRGLSRTLRIACYEVWYARKFGASTGLVIPVDRLDYGEEARRHAEAYFPSSYLFLHEVLVKGPIDCNERVFVDFGSGMGRAVLFAATLPFSKVIGVELSPSLCDIARKNLREFRIRHKQRLPEWTIINADAGSFRIPDDATVFYMANPFDASVLKRVLENIYRSLREAPRRSYLIYANPVHGDVIARGAFTQIELPHSDYAIYVSQP